LDASQIVEQGDVEAFSFESILADTEASTETVAADLPEPEDVTFDLDTDLPNFDPAPARPALVRDEPNFAPLSQPKLTAVDENFAFEPANAAVADTSPLPDLELSSDIARELLEPATRAAVRGSIGKLNALGLGNPSITIEQMTRELLRPMLKDWLDEHLPAVVERMVEREISKISRGE
jgi:cell pole-organizing protein PopZ